MRDLKWKGVSVPSQSLSLGAGKPAGIRDEVDETEGDEDDPFADLDEGADDFMGLQEVSGVGVRYQGDEKTGRKVEFYTKSDAKAQTTELVASAAVPETKTSNEVKLERRSKTGKAAEKAAEAARIAAASTSGPDDEEDEMEVGDQEEEEWEPIGTDDEHDDEVAESVAAVSDKADADETIPEGIFSSFAGELPEDDDGVDGGENFGQVSFDGELPGSMGGRVAVPS